MVFWTLFSLDFYLFLNSFLQDKLSFEYDLERLIDDWVLLGFLVGNDFIPHLPNMHINHVSSNLFALN